MNVMPQYTIVCYILGIVTGVMLVFVLRNIGRLRYRRRPNRIERMENELQELTIRMNALYDKRNDSDSNRMRYRRFRLRLRETERRIDDVYNRMNVK